MLFIFKHFVYTIEWIISLDLYGRIDTFSLLIYDFLASLCYMSID